MSVVNKWANVGQASVNRRPGQIWPKFILDPNKLLVRLFGHMHSNLGSQGTVFLHEKLWDYPLCTYLMDRLLYSLRKTLFSIIRICSLILVHPDLCKLHRQAWFLEHTLGHRGNPLHYKRDHR